jgi:hypothetical protein
MLHVACFAECMLKSDMGGKDAGWSNLNEPLRAAAGGWLLQVGDTVVAL